MRVPDVGGSKKQQQQQPLVPWQRPPSLGASIQTPGGGIAGHGGVVEDDPNNPIWNPKDIPYLPPAYGGSFEGDPRTGTPTDPNPVTNPNTPPKKDDGDKGGSNAQTTYDPYSDPFVADLMSKRDARMKGVKAQALEKQKNMLLGFGSKELARKILGDDPFVDLISDDPNTGTSWLSRSRYDYNKNVRSFNEDENAMNLFYGGGRVGGLAQRARDQTLAEADQASIVQGQLTGAWDPVITAEQQWNQMIDDAALAAYNRKMAAAGAASAAA